MTEPAESKRPRARNARPKIERAALELFVNMGVDAATTREIAIKAGVSEGALYRHYESKDELALSLFLETHNRLGRIMHDAWKKGGTLEERIRAMVDAYCQIADEDWLLFCFHLLSMHRYLPMDTRRRDDPLTITENIIQDAMDQGMIPQGRPCVLSGMALGVLTQSGQNKAYNRLPGAFSDYAEDFTRAIVAILRQK